MFVVGAPTTLDRNGLQRAFDSLPSNLPGVADFERL